jgi:hypothetical protein
MKGKTMENTKPSLPALPVVKNLIIDALPTNNNVVLDLVTYIVDKSQGFSETASLQNCLSACQEFSTSIGNCPSQFIYYYKFAKYMAENIVSFDDLIENYTDDIGKIELTQLSDLIILADYVVSGIAYTIQTIIENE